MLGRGPSGEIFGEPEAKKETGAEKAKKIISLPLTADTVDTADALNTGGRIKERGKGEEPNKDL